MPEVEPAWQQWVHRAAKYCVRQERTPAEVKQWLQRRYHLDDHQADEIVHILEQMGFIDMGRYLDYAYYHLWERLKYGRLRISAYLQQRQVPEELIQHLLDAIPEDDYRAYAERQIVRLYEQGLSAQRVFQRMVQRGFEPELVEEIMRTFGFLPEEID